MSKLQRPINPRIEFDPFRSPDWRYLRIRELESFRSVEDRPYLSTFDDEYIREGRRHYVLRYGTDPTTLDRQFEMHEACYLAFHIYDHVDTEMKKIIEARILAGQSDFEIAALCGTLPSAIDWYEKIFFNVRDRLSCRDWITRNILMPSLDYDRAESRRPLRDRQIALRYFGYFGGPLVLDSIFYGIGNHEMPTRPEEVKSWVENQIMTSIRSKAATAAQAFEPNDFNVMQLFDVFAKLVELDRASPVGGATNQIKANIIAMMDEIKITVGHLGAEKHESSQHLMRYDRQAADLRDSELIEVSRGRALLETTEEDLRLSARMINGDTSDSEDE